MELYFSEIVLAVYPHSRHVSNLTIKITFLGASLGSLASVYIWPYIEAALPKAATEQEEAKKID